MEKKYRSVRTIPKSNGKIIERGNIDTPNTYKTYLEMKGCAKIAQLMR
jgi:hypothetical protein